jgi:hypothetical protein
LNEVFDDGHLVGKGHVGGGGTGDDLYVEAVGIGILGGLFKKVGRRLEDAGNIGRGPTDNNRLLPPSSLGRSSLLSRSGFLSRSSLLGRGGFLSRGLPRQGRLAGQEPGLGLPDRPSGLTQE